MRTQITGPDTMGESNSRRYFNLRGPALLIARAAWISVAALSLVLFAFAVSPEFEYLQTPCAECDGPRLTMEAAERLERLDLSITDYAVYVLGLEVGFAAASLVVASIIFWRRSHDGTALLGALAILSWGITFPNTTIALAESYPASELPVAFLGLLSFGAFTLFFYVFPDGRLVPRWTRWLALALILLVTPSYFLPDSPFGIGTWPAALQLPYYLVWMGSLATVQIYRYRRVSGAAERQQTKWVVFGFVAAIVGFIASISVYPFLSQPGPLAYLAGNTVIYLSMLMIPLSISVAILRYRLFDIDVIINRALVYGVLTACVVGLYVLIVGYLGTVFRVEDNLLISLAATGVVAVLFQPLRDRVQRGVNRLMYGERDDPYAVISRLGERLEETLAPDAILPAIVETVREALKLPYTAIELERGGATEISASAGEPVENPTRLPLTHQNEPVGHLLLAPRPGEEDFSATDRRLLEDLARQAGVAAHAVRLTADLQSAREQLVTTREEERRRLRRDLHDGLGPMLGSLTLKLDVAGDLVEEDPASARSLIQGLKTQAQSAVTDIRRLVYALRPPALDDLGLVGAIRETAAQYNTRDLAVSIEAPDSLPDLPAAVEVAAYRIVQEAVTNTARHAGASECKIRLTLDEEAGTLELEVEDDGRGLSAERKHGVGIASMRERAEELGGGCIVKSSPESGARVRAWLPFIKE